MTYCVKHQIIIKSNLRNIFKKFHNSSLSGCWAGPIGIPNSQFRITAGYNLCSSIPIGPFFVVMSSYGFIQSKIVIYIHEFEKDIRTKHSWALTSTYLPAKFLTIVADAISKSPMSAIGHKEMFTARLKRIIIIT